MQRRNCNFNWLFLEFPTQGGISNWNGIKVNRFVMTTMRRLLHVSSFSLEICYGDLGSYISYTKNINWLVSVDLYSIRKLRRHLMTHMRCFIRAFKVRFVL